MLANPMHQCVKQHVVPRKSELVQPQEAFPKPATNNADFTPRSAGDTMGTRTANSPHLCKTEHTAAQGNMPLNPEN